MEFHEGFKENIILVCPAAVEPGHYFSCNIHLYDDFESLMISLVDEEEKVIEETEWMHVPGNLVKRKDIKLMIARPLA